MAQLDPHQARKIFRGTIDEVFKHRNEIPIGATVELRVIEEESSDISHKTLADALQEIGTVAGLPVGEMLPSPNSESGVSAL